MVDAVPAQFDPWLTTSSELGLENEPIFTTFGFQGGWVSDTDGGPFTAEMFVLPMEAIIDVVSVEAFPEVTECEGGRRTDTPPDQGRKISDGAVLPTPVAVFEYMMAGELSDSWFPHTGYVELHDSQGNIAFGKPLSGGTVDLG